MWLPTLGYESLSKRETEVLLYVAAGLANPGISKHLVIDISTVEKHLNKIYNKLATNNNDQIHARTAAVAKARYLGIVPQENIEVVLNILLTKNT